MSTATPADFPPALQPTLGVSSLDLGRSPASGPFFCPLRVAAHPIDSDALSIVQGEAEKGCPMDELGQPD
jgi:hypothetical protein